jgi:glycosyltransferase involved in cell wall biosynthesis
VGGNLEHELIPNLLLVPDFACGWIPLTIIKGLRLISAHKIDVIFATCNPMSSAIIGAILSRLSGKRLIIDLRDPWRDGIVQKMVGNRLRAYAHIGDRWKDFMDRMLETKTLGQASKVILVTQETLEVYSKLYPFLRNRLEVIHNGYADGLFAGEPGKRFDVFTIVYSGSYYYYLDKSEAFFQALANIKNDNGLNGNIRFLYIGKSSIVSKMIRKYDLSGIIDCPGYLGRKEAISLMTKASVILLRNVRPHLSTKLFEGLASGIPFIALTGEGEAANLIRKYSPSSSIVGTSDTKEIEGAIRTMYTKWTEGKLSYEVNNEFKNTFSKYKLTEKVANVLDNCMNSNAGETGLNG